MYQFAQAVYYYNEIEKQPYEAVVAADQTTPEWVEILLKGGTGRTFKAAASRIIITVPPELEFREALEASFNGFYVEKLKAGEAEYLGDGKFKMLESTRS